MRKFKQSEQFESLRQTYRRLTTFQLLVFVLIFMDDCVSETKRKA